MTVDKALELAAEPHFGDLGDAARVLAAEVQRLREEMGTWRVIGDHPILRRPDRRMMTKAQAEGYASSLCGYGYENVQVLPELPNG